MPIPVRKRPHHTLKVPESALERTAFPYHVWYTPSLAQTRPLLRVLADIKTVLLGDDADLPRNGLQRQAGGMVWRAWDDGWAFEVLDGVGVWLDHTGVTLGLPDEFPVVWEDLRGKVVPAPDSQPAE